MTDPNDKNLSPAARPCSRTARSPRSLIESTNPKVRGLDGAVASFVEYLYALG